ncbi:MAG: DUF2339 domain-containing protein, partial [Acidipropionibacterium jensenii]
NYPPPAGAPVPPVGPALAPPVGPSAAPSASPGVTERPSRRLPRVTGAVVIGAVGAAVLLAGVVMLLVLAAQHGYFGPLARVIACGVLAVALVTVGLIIHRKDPGNVGSPVLAGAGLAAGYLDITAMTWLLGTPVRAAMGVAAVLTLAGLGLAWWWGAQLIAVIATVGALVLVPFVSGDDLLTATAFLILLTAVSTPASWRRGWHVLLGCRVLPTVIYLTTLILAASPTDSRMPLLRVGAAVLAAIPFLDWWLLRPMAARLVRLGGEAVDPATVRAHALTVVPLTLPLWAAAISSPGWVAALLATALLVVSLVHWVVAKDLVMVAGCTVVTVLAGLALPIALLEGDALWLSVALLCLALLDVHRRTGQVSALWVAVVFATIPLVHAITALPDQQTTRSAAERALEALTGLAETATVVAVLLMLGKVAAESTRPPANPSAVRSGWIVAATTAACLLLKGPVTAVTDTIALLIGYQDGAAPLGRGLTTVCAAVIVTVLLMKSRGAGRGAAIRRVGGYVLMGLILIKLCLIDLEYLDGVVRVIAFIGVGLLMLTLATAYSRTIASPSGPDQEATDSDAAGVGAHDLAPHPAGSAGSATSAPGRPDRRPPRPGPTGGPDAARPPVDGGAAGPPGGGGSWAPPGT